MQVEKSILFDDKALTEGSHETELHYLFSERH